MLLRRPLLPFQLELCTSKSSTSFFTSFSLLSRLSTFLPSPSLKTMASFSSSPPANSSLPSSSPSPASPAVSSLTPGAEKSLLERTGEHISILLKTVEEQLDDLSTDLLPTPARKTQDSDPPSTSSQSAASSSSSLPGVSEQGEHLSSSSLNTSPEEWFNKNLQHVKEYYRQCFTLNHLLHTEIENMHLLREGVCGHKVYNMALQVENLELLAKQRAKTEEIRRSLKWS
ncbi:hypothetical protein CSUI_010520 [Cystoisospora suis]|uniref:Uncharacterized protein n=1 Tax=Cystoisospora suis TaxID=483139 RepID=A0A2C6KEW2_9APIC|nr:hypothetical protein CSUI_010520 [Cystoisospora suis]